MLPEPLSAAEKRKIEREKARKAKEMLEAEVCAIMLYF